MSLILDLKDKDGKAIPEEMFTLSLYKKGIELGIVEESFGIKGGKTIFFRAIPEKGSTAFSFEISFCDGTTLLDTRGIPSIPLEIIKETFASN